MKKKTLEDIILAEITRCYPLTFNYVKYVYERVKSYDQTIAFLEQSYSLGMDTHSAIDIVDGFEKFIKRNSFIESHRELDNTIQNSVFSEFAEKFKKATMAGEQLRNDVKKNYNTVDYQKIFTCVGLFEAINDLVVNSQISIEEAFKYLEDSDNYKRDSFIIKKASFIGITFKQLYPIIKALSK